MPEHDLGQGVHVTVDEEQGRWLAWQEQRDGDVDLTSEGTVGEVDLGGGVLFVDGARNRVAVVSVLSGEVGETGAGDGSAEAVQGRDAVPVLKPGAVVVQDSVQSTGGISTTEGAWPGVAIRSTVVQCLKADETCVEGLDTSGDGTVDLAVRQDAVFAWVQDEPMDGVGVHGPGETVTVLGQDYTVRDASSGWPALRAGGLRGDVTGLDEPGPHTVPGAWPWSEDATAVALPGLVPSDDLELVVEGDGSWLEPDEVHVVQGRRGSVTLLVLAPGRAQSRGEVGIRGSDGVTTLPTEQP